MGAEKASAAFLQSAKFKEEEEMVDFQGPWETGSHTTQSFSAPPFIFFS
jgi:hypothetical protein